MFCVTIIVPRNIPHIHTVYGEYYVNYQRSSRTLLWIEMMLCEIQLLFLVQSCVRVSFQPNVSYWQDTTVHMNSNRSLYSLIGDFFMFWTLIKDFKSNIIFSASLYSSCTSMQKVHLQCSPIVHPKLWVKFIWRLWKVSD